MSSAKMEKHQGIIYELELVENTSLTQDLIHYGINEKKI
jgi:hypothetical protein